MRYRGTLEEKVARLYLAEEGKALFGGGLEWLHFEEKVVVEA